MVRELAAAKAQRFPTAIRNPAAVDHESVAVDESALPTVREKRDGPGDVVG